MSLTRRERRRASSSRRRRGISKSKTLALFKRLSAKRRLQKKNVADFEQTCVAMHAAWISLFFGASSSRSKARQSSPPTIYVLPHPRPCVPTTDARSRIALSHDSTGAWSTGGRYANTPWGRICILSRLVALCQLVVVCAHLVLQFNSSRLSAPNTGLHRTERFVAILVNISLGATRVYPESPSLLSRRAFCGARRFKRTALI